MKKVIFIIIVIISVLLQYFFGKTRLYYYNSYNLFLLINEKNITNGELKISKNIFSFKNKNRIWTLRRIAYILYGT